VTEGLELRRIEGGDGPALHAILGEPEVARWLRPAGVTTPFSIEESEDWARRRAAQWAAFGYGEWLVFDGERPVARGGLGHTVAAGRAEVELGWAVVPSHQRRGIAARLALAGLAVAGERGIEGVIAYTRVDNEASRRVAERAGLRLDRAFEHAGLPHVLYRKMRPIA
jgi:RimJ/RimL family protein N-acetyltransferase